MVCSLIDVYNSHLSLKETSRDDSVYTIDQWVAGHGRGLWQVFLGDLNAEPNER